MKKIVSFEKKLTFPTMIGEITAIELEHTLKFIDNCNIEGDFIVSGKYKLTEASRLEDEFSYKIPTDISLVEKLDLNTANIEITDFYYEIENDDTMICNIEVKIEGVEEIILEEKEEEKENKDIEKLSEDNNLERNINKEEKEERECDGDIKSEEEKEIPKKEIVLPTIEKESREDNIMEVENIQIESENMQEEKVTLEDEMSENIKEIETEEVVSENDSDKEAIYSLFSALADTEETFSTYSVYILRKEETLNTVMEKYKTTKEELEKYNDLTNLVPGMKIIIPTTVK